MTSFRVEVADGCVTVEADGVGLVELGRALIVLGETWQPEPEPDLDSPLVREPQNPPKQPRAGGPFKCERCDKSYETPQAIGVHRKKAHGIAGKTTTTTSKPAQVTPIRDSRIANRESSNANPGSNGHGTHAHGEERLFCDACAFSTGKLDFAKLRQHTMSQHDGRLPSELERSPRTAAERRA